MPNWWMPPQIGLTLAGKQIGTPGPRQTTPATTDFAGGAGWKPPGIESFDPRTGGFRMDFGSENSATPTAQVNGRNPIPQNWMDVVNTALSGASSTPQVQPTAPPPFQPPDLSQWMLWKDLGKDMQDYLINSVKGGFAEGSFGNNPNQLVSWSMLGGKDRWGNKPQTISPEDWIRGGGGVGPRGESKFGPGYGSGDIKTEVTRMKDWMSGFKNPSQTTNSNINSMLQRLISGFGGGAATAQPTQMPSWWNTGRSVYPWGRGSTS